MLITTEYSIHSTLFLTPIESKFANTFTDISKTISANHNSFILNLPVHKICKYCENFFKMTNSGVVENTDLFKVFINYVLMILLQIIPLHGQYHPSGADEMKMTL